MERARGSGNGRSGPGVKRGLVSSRDRHRAAASDGPASPSRGRVEAPVNPFAIGAQFLDYCVGKGWLRQEGGGRGKRWYLTDKGEEGLGMFGIRPALERRGRDV